MKYVLQTAILIITWPIVAFIFLVFCLAWLALYCWGCKDVEFMATDDIKGFAYCLWHLQIRPKKKKK